MELRYDPYIEKGSSTHQQEEYNDRYPVPLINGDTLVIPIVPFPPEEGREERAISLLMSTGLSFEVSDTLGALLAEQVAALSPDVIVGIPTLGLGWAEKVARHLGHPNFVPLSTTRKFWYGSSNAEELSSITGVGQKQLYLPPEVAYRIAGHKRVVVVDDVICTGGSLLPAVKLIKRAGGQVAGIGVVLTEGTQWQKVLTSQGLDRAAVVSIGRIPLFEKKASGAWAPMPE